jgi:hypothetical protein
MQEAPGGGPGAQFAAFADFRAPPPASRQRFDIRQWCGGFTADAATLPGEFGAVCGKFPGFPWGGNFPARGRAASSRDRPFGPGKFPGPFLCAASGRAPATLFRARRAAPTTDWRRAGHRDWHRHSQSGTVRPVGANDLPMTSPMLTGTYHNAGSAAHHAARSSSASRFHAARRTPIRRHRVLLIRR